MEYTCTVNVSSVIDINICMRELAMRQYTETLYRVIYIYQCVTTEQTAQPFFLPTHSRCLTGTKIAASALHPMSVLALHEET